MRVKLIFTDHKQSCGKVMFYTCMSVILFTGGRGLCQGGGETPLDRDHPSPVYGKERAVPILLECILVIREKAMSLQMGSQLN